MDLLDGKVALVTGAARGNGAEIARGLATHGANVALVDINGDGAAATAEAIAKETNRQALGLAGDVGDPAAAESMVEETVSQLGGLDIVVNNAGILEAAHFLKMTIEQWDRTLRVNLTGAMLVSQCAARVMRRSGGGSIVHVSSVAGENAFPGSTAYCATKGGLNALTRAMSLDLAPFSIRVNAIAPGMIDTAMVGALKDNESLKSTIESSTPAGRFGVPEDLTGAVVFLASELSEFVTGSVLTADGGLTAGFSGWKG
jgi:NAD(P)-dependent dehydrogenase (short-subunit alcohol dehydrogenase family)